MPIRAEDDDRYYADLVMRHERILCGGEGFTPLEDKVKAYALGLYEHEKNNRKEEIQAIRGTSDERHKENTTKLDTLTRLVYIGVGIIITLNAIGLGLLVHAASK